MTIQRWDGSEFVVGGTLRRWDGAEWQPPAVVEFDPTTIPDLHAWLNPDTLSAGDIGTFPDSSGYHNDFSTAGYFNAPLVVASGVNGHNIVRFDAANNEALRWQGSGLAADYHVFTVARMLPGAHARLIGSIYPANANFTAGWHGGQEAAFYNGSVFLAGGGQPATNNVWRRMEMSGPTTSEGRMNGNIWGSASGGASFNGGVALGGYALDSNSEVSDFELAMLLIFSRVLDDDERAAVDQWLVTRFAL